MTTKAADERGECWAMDVTRRSTWCHEPKGHSGPHRDFDWTWVEPTTGTDSPPAIWRAHMRLRHVNYGHGEISQVVEVDFERDTVTVVSPEGVESEWKITDVREVSG